MKDENSVALSFWSEAKNLRVVGFFIPQAEARGIG